MQGKSARIVDATSGYVANKLSDAYAALLSIALHLSWEEKVAELMEKIARRIHAAMQSQRLGMIRGIWRRYLLSGWLRDAVRVDSESLRQYARFVRATTERRLRDGPSYPHDLYTGWTIRQIVEEIDRNTVAGARNQSGDIAIRVDTAKFFNGAMPSTVGREPCAPEQIAEAESRIGRALPSEMKEFYSVTDGFVFVKCESDPVDFEIKFPPLAEVVFEDEDTIGGIGFELVRGLMHVAWPEILGGGVGFYESDGQGTMYTWRVRLIDQHVER